jgi:hypothetical protein
MGRIAGIWSHLPVTPREEGAVVSHGRMDGKKNYRTMHQTVIFLFFFLVVEDIKIRFESLITTT